MNPNTLFLFLRIFAQAALPVLADKGKSQQAEYLGTALKAIQSGKNIDAELAAAADRWEREGEPSIEQIVADRQAIQARIDG